MTGHERTEIERRIDELHTAQASHSEHTEGQHKLVLEKLDHLDECVDRLRRTVYGSMGAVFIAVITPEIIKAIGGLTMTNPDGRHIATRPLPDRVDHALTLALNDLGGWLRDLYRLDTDGSDLSLDGTGKTVQGGKLNYDDNGQPASISVELNLPLGSWGEAATVVVYLRADPF